jgi:hypothetical protein
MTHLKCFRLCGEEPTIPRSHCQGGVGLAGNMVRSVYRVAKVDSFGLENARSGEEWPALHAPALDAARFGLCDRRDDDFRQAVDVQTPRHYRLSFLQASDAKISKQLHSRPGKYRTGNSDSSLPRLLLRRSWRRCTTNLSIPSMCQ